MLNQRVLALVLTSLMFVLTAALIVGCGSITKGYVISKQDIPAHPYIYKKPFPSYVPEAWIVDISSCPPSKSQANCDTAEIYVSQSTYNQLRIGQYVDFSNR